MSDGADGRKIRITQEGFAALQAEAATLWKEERPRVTLEVEEAAAHGDRSENAEYIYGKKRLREIDRRLRWLSKRMDELVVVDPRVTGDPARVDFGAWVKLEDEDGKVVRYQIVGPDEFDVPSGKISIESPVGRALLGRQVDDEVEVQRPKGPICYTVVAIDYE